MMDVSKDMVPTYYGDGGYKEVVVTHPLDDKFLTIGVRGVPNEDGSTNLVVQLILEDAEGRIGDTAFFINLPSGEPDTDKVDTLIHKEIKSFIEGNCEQDS